MKTVTQKEQPSINLQVGHCLQSIHLIIQKKKKDLIIIEEYIVLKSGVKK